MKRKPIPKPVIRRLFGDVRRWPPYS